MANASLIHEDVGQLLQEAGCTDEFTHKFLVMMETENPKTLLCLLRGQRSYQLDRLDYLRCKLEKELPADTKPNRRRY